MKYLVTWVLLQSFTNTYTKKTLFHKKVETVVEVKTDTLMAIFNNKQKAFAFYNSGRNIQLNDKQSQLKLNGEILSIKIDSIKTN